jgi:hypothetical protein
MILVTGATGNVGGELAEQVVGDLTDPKSPFVQGEFDDAAVVPTVREITGRPPRTFEQWAHAHADKFR